MLLDGSLRRLPASHIDAWSHLPPPNMICPHPTLFGLQTRRVACLGVLTGFGGPGSAGAGRPGPGLWERPGEKLDRRSTRVFSTTAI